MKDIKISYPKIELNIEEHNAEDIFSQNFAISLLMPQSIMIKEMQNNFKIDYFANLFKVSKIFVIVRFSQIIYYSYNKYLEYKDKISKLKEIKKLKNDFNENLDNCNYTMDTLLCLSYSKKSHAELNKNKSKIKECILKCEKDILNIENSLLQYKPFLNIVKNNSHYEFKKDL